MFLVAWVFAFNSFADDSSTEIIYGYHINPETRKTEWEITALINMNKIYNKPGEGCGQRMTFAKISALQFSDSGNSIKLIQLVEESGRVFAAPIEYQKLSNVKRKEADQFLIQGNKYFIFYQVCGSGGFVNIINMYGVDRLLRKK